MNFAKDLSDDLHIILKLKLLQGGKNVRVIFEGKPLRTFQMNVVFSVGWRNEPPKYKGIVRDTLDAFIERVSETVPQWYELGKIIEAEFSFVRIWGTSKEIDNLKEGLEKGFLNLSPSFVEIGGGVLFSVIVGGVKKTSLEQFRKIKSPSPLKPQKLFSKPRNFIKLTNITRLESLFLREFLSKREKEVFLEISKGVDRLFFGRVTGDMPSYKEMEEFLGFFKASILKRLESTSGTADFLTYMNVFSKDKVSIDDILTRLEKLELLKFLEVLKKLY